MGTEESEGRNVPENCNEFAEHVKPGREMATLDNHIVRPRGNKYVIRKDISTRDRTVGGEGESTLVACVISKR